MPQTLMHNAALKPSLHDAGHAKAEHQQRGTAADLGRWGHVPTLFRPPHCQAHSSPASVHPHNISVAQESSVKYIKCMHSLHSHKLVSLLPTHSTVTFTTSETRTQIELFLPQTRGENYKLNITSIVRK